MTNDDDRIAHLMGEPAEALDEADRVALDDLRGLLADRDLWASPSDGLQDRVVAAIGQEAGARAPTAVRPATAARPARLRRQRTRWLPALVAVAAVLLVAVLAGTALLRSDHGGGTRRYVALAAVGGSGASGSATLTRTDAGWRIELHAQGLARLDDDTYYEAWLKKDDGVLVPIGTFNQGGDLTLWAGVSPAEYTTFTVTAEAADGNQASSGRQVLAGAVTDRPA